MGTIQLDSQMPARFGLTLHGRGQPRAHPCVDPPRAASARSSASSASSIEHYGGAFPFWLAPVQVRADPGRREPPRGRAARSASASRPGLPRRRRRARRDASASGSATPSSRRSRTSSSTATASRTTRSPSASGAASSRRGRSRSCSRLSLASLLRLRLKAGADPFLTSGARALIGGSTESVDEDQGRCLQRFLSFEREDSDSLVTAL